MDRDMVDLEVAVPEGGGGQLQPRLKGPGYMWNNFRSRFCEEDEQFEGGGTNFGAYDEELDRIGTAIGSAGAVDVTTRVALSR